MRITQDQIKNMLADTYGCSYKDVHFIDGVHAYELPTPKVSISDDLPFGSIDDFIQEPAATLTGGGIFAEIRREEKELKEIQVGLNELEDDHRGDRAWDILVHAHAEQEKKVRELKNREYTY